MSTPSELESSMGLSWWSSPTTFWLAIVVVIVAGLYLFWLRDDDNWMRYGVKQPKLPWFYFLGEDFRAIFSNVLNRYGDIVGVAVGKRMILITSNRDLLHHIMVKDFNNFTDRDEELMTNSPLGKSLFFATGSNWRRSRQIISPSFNTGNLNYIYTFVDRSAKNLATYLEKPASTGELVPVKEICGRFTCDIIAKAAFGLDADLLREKNLEFYDHAKNMINFQQGISRVIFVTLSLIPELLKFCNKTFRNMQVFDVVNLKAGQYFDSVMKTTIEERRKQQQLGHERPRKDILDVLLAANNNAKATETAKVDSKESKENNEVSSKAVKKVMSDQEVLGQALLLIFAGHETTASTVQMCLYELAAHENIQDKVYEEIQRVVGSDSPTPDELKQLTYMEQVINEVLRLFPPVPIVSRRAKETKTYGGVTIPEGKLVMIPIYHILKDPQIWPNPEKFDPDRFSQEEKEKRYPTDFLAFGQGPRLCLGMRLAYQEIKAALVNVLAKFKVVVNEKTEPKKGFPVEILPTGFVVPKKPIMLEFEMRK